VFRSRRACLARAIAVENTLAFTTIVRPNCVAVKSEDSAGAANLSQVDVESQTPRIRGGPIATIDTVYRIDRTVAPVTGFFRKLR
jgi:hypothetical protein